MVYDFIAIIPIWSFLLFHDPHDCFKCLGKDPVRKYSKFQYDRVERMKMRYRAKFGQEKCKYMDDMDSKKTFALHRSFTPGDLLVDVSNGTLERNSS